MKLLIVTQRIDKDDPILGFVHGWAEKLAEAVPKVTIICLGKGRFDLPANVAVLSLGKEEGEKSRFAYAFRFWKYIWRERNEYDAVFVHMNQEYVLLGGLFWKAFGKKVLMWRNHRYGNWLTRIAVALSDTVFCTSPQSYAAHFKNSVLMPAGIDTEHFKPLAAADRISRSVLYAGRISPNKRPELLVRAADALWTEGAKFKVSIVGDPSKGSEEFYRETVKSAALLEREGVIAFYEGVPQELMPELYSSHQIFANLTETGSFDKTVLEAMACESLPLTSNIAYRALFPSEYRDMLCFKDNDAEDLSVKLSALLDIPASEREAAGRVMRELVIEKHSLRRLIEELAVYLND